MQKDKFSIFARTNVVYRSIIMTMRHTLTRPANEKLKLKNINIILIRILLYLAFD